MPNLEDAPPNLNDGKQIFPPFKGEIPQRLKDDGPRPIKDDGGRPAADRKPADKQFTDKQPRDKRITDENFGDKKFEDIKEPVKKTDDAKRDPEKANPKRVAGGLPPAPCCCRSCPPSSKRRQPPADVSRNDPECGPWRRRPIPRGTAKLRQVAIFDVCEAKVVKYLPVAGDNAVIAAGMTKLVMAFPDTKIIQRGNSPTYEKELTTTLPLNDRVVGMGMGYGSDGPLLVQGSRDEFSGEMVLLDLKSMKQLDLPNPQGGGGFRNGMISGIRGNHDGRRLTVGCTLYQISATGMARRGGSESAFCLMPGWDGKHIFGMGVFSDDMKRLASSPAPSNVCVPATHGPYYLSIPAGSYHPQIAGDRKEKGIELRIVGDSRPLLPLPDVETAMYRRSAGNRDPWRPDQRSTSSSPTPNCWLRFRPSATVWSYELDLDVALEKSEIDYLLVTSSPRPIAVLGEDYVYPVRVKSKKGGLVYKLDAAPEGMTVAKDGTIRWKTPKNFEEPQVDVIMTISDAASQEIFHTFKVAVLKESPPEAKLPVILPPPQADPEPKTKVVEKTPDPKVETKAPVVAPNALAIQAPKLEGERVTRKLPDRMDQVVVGGGGRFILMHLPQSRKVAMFDVNEAKVVHYFPVSGDGVKIAAGLEKRRAGVPRRQDRAMLESSHEGEGGHYHRVDQRSHHQRAAGRRLARAAHSRWRRSLRFRWRQPVSLLVQLA